ncbi:MAG: hypothetical protein HYX39_09690 [Bacteroidetes bacterium]|nr:hypothetical protein [Bacteroidota bacterium]
MIKQFILPLLAVVLLGSCANKFSLVKRKYNKGYYLDMAGKTSKPENKQEKIATLTPKKVTKISDNLESIAEIKTSAIKTLPLVNQSQVKASGAVAKETIKNPSAPLTASAHKTLFTNPVHFKAAALKHADNKTSAAKGDSDVNTLVLVILALFPILSLFAVYLHDGKKITLNFWITLLLHLTIIGYAIFAVLVVLDIINLA